MIFWVIVSSLERHSNLDIYKTSNMVKVQNLFGEVRQIHRNRRALFKREGIQKAEPGVCTRPGATCRSFQARAIEKIEQANSVVGRQNGREMAKWPHTQEVHREQR